VAFQFDIEAQFCGCGRAFGIIGINLNENQRTVGLDARLGSPFALFEHFAEWKKVDDENELWVISLETMIRAIGRPERFLDIVENFIAFEEEKKGLVKKLAKNHQYLGANRTIEAVTKL
jgi:type I restriction enzyme R subunit